MATKRTVTVSTYESKMSAIRKGLSHVSFKAKPSVYLDLKDPDLNICFGDRDFGAPYGNMIEVFGWESVGKSAIIEEVSAIGQRDGAHVIWEDLENSFKPRWALKRGFVPCPFCKGSSAVALDMKCKHCGGSESPMRGLDPDRLTLISPYVGQFEYIDKRGNKRLEKEPRLASAEELCAETEAAMKLHDKSILVLDSIGGMMPEGESKAGLENLNMRTSMNLPVFVGNLCRRWVGLSQVHRCLLIIVNQLREGPGGFNADKTMGGNAPRFYAHTRLKLRRVKGSRIVDKGKTIGIRGVMKIVKNKAGGEEGHELGYKIFKDGPIEFISAKEAKENEEQD